MPNPRLFRAYSDMIPLGDGQERICWICSAREQQLLYDEWIPDDTITDMMVRDIAFEYIRELFSEQEIEQLRAYLAGMGQILKTTEEIQLPTFSSDENGTIEGVTSWGNEMGNPDLILREDYDGYNLVFSVVGYFITPSVADGIDLDDSFY